MSSGNASRRDLAVLVPDADTAQGVEALLRRHQSLQIRQISFRIYRHEERDPGCRGAADAYLGPLRDDHDHALVLFDKEGCGSSAAPEDIEAEVRGSLEQVGWSGRCDVVVIDPELESWVWSDSPNVAEGLGWRGSMSALREWLEGKGLWDPGERKPHDPKAAVERVRRKVRQRRSPRLYGMLGRTVTTRRCVDRSFKRLVTTLQRWFPAT